MPRKPRTLDAPKVPTPPHLPVSTTLADAVDNFDTIIAWAKAENSAIGYFATIYKRATLAIDKATKTPKVFRNPRRMVEFAKTFSQRYFDALNAYFAPPGGEPPTSVWKCHFDGAKLEQPIILQHLLTAVNAHINLDLGIAACQIGGSDLPGLHDDFNTVNAILGSQIQGVLDALGQVSPGIQIVRGLLPGDEVEEIRKLLIAFRDAAWNYAITLSDNEDMFDELVERQDVSTTALGECYLNPPGKINYSLDLIKYFERSTVPDVIAALDVDVTKIAPLNTRFLD